VDFFSQNLCAKHTERAKSSGSPCVAAGLRGDGPAREHLATDVEAAHRGTRRRLTDVYCTPGQGEYILSVGEIDRFELFEHGELGGSAGG